MKRTLIYLVIFTTCAWSSLAALVFTFNPTDAQGRADSWLVGVFVGLFFTTTTLTLALIFSVVKAFLPAHKLPHLLIRDSLIQGALVSLGISGLLVLQLLRAASSVNMLLWLAIIAALGWMIHEWRKSASTSESTSGPVLSGRWRRK